MTRTLIVSTCYIGAGAQGYGIRLVELWAKLLRYLNPITDAIMIDSASPTDPTDMLKKYNIKTRRFDDNIGHLNVSGKDGWGRAFCKGVEIAINLGYEHICYMDADIIFARAVAPIIDKLAKFGVKAACPMDITYNFIENGIMFLDVGYLKESKFIERYDWPSRTIGTTDATNIPEVAFEKLLEDVLFTLPLRGIRNDFDRITANNLAFSFPYGLDFLTHCKDFAIYERFLEMKGIKL